MENFGEAADFLTIVMFRGHTKKKKMKNWRARCHRIQGKLVF